MTFDAAVTLLKISNAKAIFGNEPYKKYRELAKVLHPDVAPPSKKKAAERAFRLLGELYGSLNGKSASKHPRIIGQWAVGDPLAKGDLCDLYHAFGPKTDEVVFKIARNEADNDLLAEEHFHLGRLNKFDDEEAKNYLKYLPLVHETLEVSGRRTNVLSLARGFVPLKDILTYHPNGSLDFRHAIWMVNRGLSILGFLARKEVVHGAILPAHLLYHPEHHGLKLVDWCYAVTAESKKHVPAIVKEYKHLYPPEIIRKMVPQPSTDIFMLFNSIKASGIKIPRRFSKLLDHCLAQSPNSRPGDAWEVQDRWIALAKEEYGPPTYLKLEIPVS